MSTSKVGKYNNHNDNIIITISISKSSNPQQYTKHTMRWLQRQDNTHNRECRGDSNRYTPCRGKNLTNTSYAWLPEALTYDNRLRSPYSIKIGPLSTGEVLALGLIPPPTTSLRQGVRFDEVVTGVLGLSGSIKTWHVVSTQLKTCHQGQNSAVLNLHGWGLPHKNLGIATAFSPTFPSKCSTDPPTCPAWSSNSE
jgi:hypothetical protein